MSWKVWKLKVKSLERRDASQTLKKSPKSVKSTEESDKNSVARAVVSHSLLGTTSGSSMSRRDEGLGDFPRLENTHNKSA